MELLAYALRRRQYRALARCALAETLLLGTVRMLWLWRPAATLWTFLIPYMVTSLALMFGNWCAPQGHLCCDLYSSTTQLAGDGCPSVMGACWVSLTAYRHTGASTSSSTRGLSSQRVWHGVQLPSLPGQCHHLQRRLPH